MPAILSPSSKTERTLKLYRSFLAFYTAWVDQKKPPSTAAEELQPLEYLLQAKLVRQSPEKSLVFTPTAQRLFPAAQKLLDILEKGPRLSTLFIEAVYSVGLYRLPAFLKKFRNAHPEVPLHVEFHFAPRILEHLAAHRTHLGLFAFPPDRPDLECYSFGWETMGLVCSATHPLAGRSRISLRQLQDYPFFFFPKHTPTRKALEKTFRKVGVPLKIAQEYEHVDDLKKAVRMEKGVTILPLSTVKAEKKKRFLTFVRFRDLPLERPLGFLRIQEKPLTPEEEIFLTFRSIFYS